MLSSNISRIFNIAKYYLFSFFLKFSDNVLKIDHRSFVSNILMCHETKMEVSRKLDHRYYMSRN